MARPLILGDHSDLRLAHREVDATIALFPSDIEAGWVCTDSAAARELVSADGVWLVSGGPYRSDDAVFHAIDHCLDSGMPFLGTCSGFQYTCLALARRQGSDAFHAELDAGAPDPVIAPLACGLCGESRLIRPIAGTRLSEMCGNEPFLGFHNCDYRLAAEHEQTIELAGAKISARADSGLVEAIELPRHPFFLATQFHPQVGASASGVIHPLIRSLLESAQVSRTQATRLISGLAMARIVNPGAGGSQ